jgi:predicted transcriptional regulator of viral defense system
LPKSQKDWIPHLEIYLSTKPPEVFNQSTIETFIRDLKSKQLIPSRLNYEDLLAATSLGDKISLAKIEHIGKANPQKTELIRYLINSPFPFSIALSLRSRSYLSHSSAVFLNGLSDQIPKNIFVNKEQLDKYWSNELTQEGIDRAFENKGRQSNYIWSWNDYRFTLLNGKNTKEHGVINIKLETGEIVRTTNLERTLIDIVVRPAYCGGIDNLIEIYHRAKDRVSAKQIIKALKKLDHSYPYHQSIGFLMERAGFEKNEYEQLRKLGMDYDFYLDYKIKNKKYDKNWRIYYPKELDY